MKIYLLIGFLIFPFLLSAQKQFVQTKKMYLSAPLINATSNLFQDSMRIELALRHPGTIIRYELNDSTVTEQSPAYVDPIVLKKNGLLSAKAFHPDYLPSKTFRQYFYQATTFAPLPEIHCQPAPKAPYNSAGTNALLNLVKGTKDFRRDKSWLGFQGDTIYIALDFPERVALEAITFSFMEDQGSWIFLPQRLEVWANDKLLGSKILEGCDKQTAIANATQFVALDLKSVMEKNYTLKIINLPALPDWHPGKGGKPWLFIDEIFSRVN